MLLEELADMKDYLVSNITGARVTSDGVEAGNLLAAGNIVLLIQPPALTIEHTLGSFVPQYEWDIILATGPADDPLRALTAMDPVLSQIITSDLDPTAARPNTLQALGGSNYPCYIITTTTTD